MSSDDRQQSPLYQLQCRALIDTLFYSVLCLFLLSSWHLRAAFKLRRLETSWKINLGHPVAIHNNNLDYKALIFVTNWKTRWNNIMQSAVECSSFEVLLRRVWRDNQNSDYCG